jgi:triosephosphate isomerase
MRRPLIAGNWKMYTDPLSAGELAGKLKSTLGNCSWADIAIFPPFTSIHAVVTQLGNSKIEVGGQNIYWQKEGAYTGEISPSMLSGAGCKWVIIGHSERRSYFGEKDATVLKKIIAALDAGLRPIVCIGETLEQRESGITENVIQEQLLSGIGPIDDISQITIAYEPVWAIGTGRNATPQQAGEIHIFIRSLVADRWGMSVADKIRILYGGSVKPDNSKALWDQADIDGFLIGGASLKAESFAAIAESVK